MNPLPPITGTIIRVGTMAVSGEKLTGVFVEVGLEQILALPTLPLYHEVGIYPVPTGAEVPDDTNARETIAGLRAELAEVRAILAGLREKFHAADQDFRAAVRAYEAAMLSRRGFTW